jgi:hypothetical protein
VGGATALIVGVSALALCGGSESGNAMAPQSPSLLQLLNGMVWAAVHALRYSVVVAGVPEKQPWGPSPELAHVPWRQTTCAVLLVSNLAQSTSVLHCTMVLSTITLHALMKGSTKVNAKVRVCFKFAIASFSERSIAFAMLVNRPAERTSLALDAEN